MAHLTLAGLSDDGLRLLLVDDNGAEFTLDIDAPLRAAVRGDHARIGQLEIQMDSSLRPRDIQTRIRGGETPEAVAQAAQTSVDKIMVFAAPVLAERAHVAQRAQASSLRRKAGDTGARTLGEAISAHLHGFNIDPAGVEWDAWRREDGRWHLTGSFSTAQRTGSATFAFDVRGNFVTTEDDDARWLVGEAVAGSSRSAAPATPGQDDLQQARVRRLSAVPADELPLGDDAIGLVSDVDPLVEQGRQARVETEDPAETTLDLSDLAAVEEDPLVEQDRQARVETEEPGDPAVEDEHDPAENEPPSRRPARKGRGRASVPSWDEIMFGGPSD